MERRRRILRAVKTDQGTGQGIVAEVKAQGAILFGFAALLWVIQIVNAVVFGGNLFLLGVTPRSVAGLFGILLAPFLHANFAHLIANTVPLLVLGWFVMLRRKRDLFTVSALSALVGGLGTWLIAPSHSVHAGASVLVFGYLGYLLVRGVLERRFLPIVGSLIVFVLYGGALSGVLPGALGVSWQGHLFGLLGGVLAARLLRNAPTSEAPAKLAPQRVPPRVQVAPARVRVPVAAPRKADAEAEAEVDAELEQIRQRLAR